MLFSSSKQTFISHLYKMGFSRGSLSSAIFYKIAVQIFPDKRSKVLRYGNCGDASSSHTLWTVRAAALAGPPRNRMTSRTVRGAPSIGLIANFL